MSRALQPPQVPATSKFIDCEGRSGGAVFPAELAWCLPQPRGQRGSGTCCRVSARSGADGGGGRRSIGRFAGRADSGPLASPACSRGPSEDPQAPALVVGGVVGVALVAGITWSLSSGDEYREAMILDCERTVNYVVETRASGGDDQWAPDGTIGERTEDVSSLDMQVYMKGLDSPAFRAASLAVVLLDRESLSDVQARIPELCESSSSSWLETQEQAGVSAGKREAESRASDALAGTDPDAEDAVATDACELLRSIENEPAVEEQLGGLNPTYGADAPSDLDGDSTCSVAAEFTFDEAGMVQDDLAYRFDLTLSTTPIASYPDAALLSSSAAGCEFFVVAVESATGELVATAQCPDLRIELADVPGAGKPSVQAPGDMLELVEDLAANRTE